MPIYAVPSLVRQSTQLAVKSVPKPAASPGFFQSLFGTLNTAIDTGLKVGVPAYQNITSIRAQTRAITDQARAVREKARLDAEVMREQNQLAMQMQLAKLRSAAIAEESARMPSVTNRPAFREAPDGFKITGKTMAIGGAVVAAGIIGLLLLKK